jgi:hypothetical protein
MDRFSTQRKIRAKGWFGRTERQKWASPAALSNVTMHVGLHGPGAGLCRVFAPCPQQLTGTNKVEMGWLVIFLPWCYRHCVLCKVEEPQKAICDSVRGGETWGGL